MAEKRPWYQAKQSGDVTEHLYAPFDRHLAEKAAFYRELRTQLEAYLAPRIEALRTARALPMGLDEFGNPMSLLPGQNALLLTGANESTGRELMTNIVRGSHIIQPFGAQSLHVVDGRGSKLWESFRPMARAPIENDSHVRTLVRLGSEDVLDRIQPGLGLSIRNSAAANIGVVAHIAGRYGDELAQGGVFEIGDAFGRRAHLVGGDSIVMLDRVEPGQTRGELGEQLAFLFGQFHQTPAARVLRSITHLNIRDLFRAKTRDVQRLADITRNAKIVPVLSDEAVRALDEVQNSVDLDLSGFGAARDRLLNTEQPQVDGFHVLNGSGESVRVTPFG